MPGTITQGSSQVVSVTTSTRIGLNSAMGTKAYIEATSGVPGSTVKQKLAVHDGGFAVYGPFGVGTVTIFAVSGSIYYDETDPVQSSNQTEPVFYNPTSSTLDSSGGVGVASVPRSALWADRAALVSAGVTLAFFTDVGVGGGSFWEYRGGRWRPQAGRVIIKNLITPVSNSGAPKVVMDYATILAGLWQDGDSLEIDALKTREGGTSDTDATDLMIGTVSATLGTSTGFTSSALATTTIQYRMLHELRRESATSVRTMAIAGGGGGFGTTTSLTTLTTGLTSLDTTEQYLQITSDLTTAGGEVAWLRKFRVTLIAGA